MMIIKIRSISTLYTYTYNSATKENNINFNLKYVKKKLLSLLSPRRFVDSSRIQLYFLNIVLGQINPMSMSIAV